MHLMLQKINFAENYDYSKLDNLRQFLIHKKIITVNQAKAININKILQFLNTDFANRIKNAKQIQREKMFCTKVLAKEIFSEANEETILVQGIIDLFFVDANDKLILVDYKTDYIENGQEECIINKYKKQLEIYEKALSEALERKVDEKYIYSLYLNKEILL